ncbi:MAG: RDD family protein [bacterium]|nr:RDD family protein [bacterium]
MSPETEDSPRSLAQGGVDRNDSETTPSGSEGEGFAPQEQTGASASVPEGFGWDGLTNSVPGLLLGKVGLVAVLAGWLVGYTSDPGTLRDTLDLSLTPLAVMVGFGLKHLYGAVKAIVNGLPLGAKERNFTLLKLLSFGGTIGAVLGVLAYSLVPDFDTEILWILDGIVAQRVLGGFILMWVALAFTLLVRLPLIAVFGRQLVDAMEAWQESPLWETIRKARRKDNRLVALLVVATVAWAIVKGSPPFEDAALLVTLLLAFAYEGFCAVAFGGTTYGKWRTRLRVVADDGSRLSRWRAFKRSFVLYAPLVAVGVLRLDAVLGMGIFVLALPIVVMYGLGSLHPYQRGFADLITGTQVVAKAA